MRSRFVVMLLAAALAFGAVNRRAAVLADFSQRVDAYAKLRASAESGMSALRPTDSPEAIAEHETELAGRIRAARAGAKQGDIFTQQIVAEFHHLIHMVWRREMAATLEKNEPVDVPVQVNQPYPKSTPLQSTPPEILANLPKLPPHLEYRIVGRDLVLRDIGANLVIDIAPGVLPKYK